MKANLKIVQKMELGYIDGLMEHHMLDNLKKIKYMGMEK